MGEVVAWALLGGALALFTQRRALSVLVGTVVAVVGTVVKITAVVVLAGGLLGASAGQASSGSAALAPVAKAAALIIFGVCAAGVLVLIRAVTTGMVWPRGR